MLFEMYQVYKFLAEKHGIPLVGDGPATSRLETNPPDGEHVVPLGTSQTPTRVVVRDGLVYIDPKNTRKDLGYVFNVLGRAKVDFFEVLEEIFLFVHGHDLTTEWIDRVRAKWHHLFTEGGAEVARVPNPKG